MSIFNFLKKKPAETLPAPPQPLPQRNDPCWCDSGVKYKKCHLKQDQQTLLQIKEQQLAQKKRRSLFS